jgi:NADPH:quinone reductase-like Zn-dependent oxidoreductase
MARMKTIVLRGHGGTEQLQWVQDFPMPEVGERDVLVRVRATSVNRIDLVVREGYPGISIKFPHILGADIAGTVERIGPEVRAFQEGDRVLVWPLIACGKCALCRRGQRWLCLNWQYFGLHRHGAYAEYVRVPEESVIPLPEGLSFEEAATLPVAGLTAYHALVTVGKLKAGETVLIWGGSGGVGTFAVQIAKQLGARVIATVGSDEKCAKVEALGADLVLNHHHDDVEPAVREFTEGLGVAAVLDYVGPQTFAKSFQLLQKGGRLLLCGKLTGMDVQLSVHQTYLRHLSILGLYLGEKHELERLLRWMLEGKIRPVIDRVMPLEEAPQAQRLMESGRHVGKIVLVP